MKALAVIPARMGSQRVPGKNLRLVSGMSLVQHAVQHAAFANIFDSIVISTDDPEAVYASGVHGAEIIRRPDEISGPTSDISAAVKHAWQQCGSVHDTVVCLQPAVMARSASIIKALVDACAKHQCCGITMAASNPWQWTVRGMSAGAPWLPGPYPRSQDSGERLSEINAVQVSTAAAVDAGYRWIPPLAIARLPAWCASLDIDTEEDLTEAAEIYPFASRRLQGYIPDVTVCEVPQC